MLMLHPAQPRKGHADMQRRNILWPACHQPATLQRITAFLSQWQPAAAPWSVQQLLQTWGWLQMPLFDPQLLFPSLDELIEWLHQTGSSGFDLPAALQLAEPHCLPFHWLCRAYQASSRLLVLLGSYYDAIDLSLLLPHCAAAQRMRDMCALDRRHEPLHGIDVSWCEQHVPALEQLIVSVLDADAMREARDEWLRLYNAGIAETENVRAQCEQFNAERFEYSAAGLRGERRSDGDLLNPVHDAVTKKVVTANFESVVLDSGRDVLLGMEWRMQQEAVRDLSLCIRLLIPAAARIIRLYQQQRGIGLAAAHSAPPGRRQHGESLVFGIMLAGQGASHNRCDLDVNWIDPDDYRAIISCDSTLRSRVGIGAGAFLLYPAGEKPSQEHYGFYSLMRSVYKQPLRTHAPWLARGEQPFLQPFNPPTLSSLLRSVHANMRGGTFDLDAVLALAAPYEAASVLVGRLQDAQQDVRDAMSYPVRGEAEVVLGPVFSLMRETTLEALTDSAIFQAAEQQLALLDDRKATILSNIALNKERKRKVAEKKRESDRSQQSDCQVDERSKKQRAALQLVKPGKRNQAAVRRLLRQMRPMPRMDAWAWHPAAARLHLYVEPGTASGRWCLLFEVLGWWDTDSSMSAQHVGEQRLYAEGPAAVDDGCRNGWPDFCDDTAVQHAHYEREQEGDGGGKDEKGEDGDDDDSSMLSPCMRWVRIRQQRVPVIHELNALAELAG